MAEKCGMFCGICRICLHTTYKSCCCIKDPPSPPQYKVICLGITNSGKSTLLAVMTNENTNNIVPTIGFSIKDVQLPNATLKVKELGGGDQIREFWSRYYNDVDGVIFVIDGLCTHDRLEDTRREIHGALKHPELCSLPWMILCNKQDLEGACTHHKVKEELQLRSAMQENNNIVIKSCSKTNKSGLIEDFETFTSLMNRYYSNNEHNAQARL